ncbi:MAG: hypothetical protein RLY20_2286 [Verrucomicrobiota bacterium]|jgi:hypothetical protein
MKNKSVNLVATITAGLSLAAAAHAADAQKTDWTSELIAPVANPILFESPTIGSELRPIFMEHSFNDNLGGDAQVYALQFRLKLNDKLALIATKDGYVNMNCPALPNRDGFADIAAGLKYQLVNDEKNKLLVTPGFTYTIPIGSSDVFQGSDHGDGYFDLFVSAAKEFDKVQITGNLGIIAPLDSDKDTTQLHYSLQAAYPVNQWFKPFVVMNGYTVLSEGNVIALGSEGYDVINFGTSNASGENQIVLGAGFRSALNEKLDLGIAFEKGVDHSTGIFDNRLTVDLVWKF